MKKCVFLIPFGSNFSKRDGKPIIGSSTHITIGIQQLAQYADVHPLIINTPSQSSGQRRTAPRASRFRNNRFIGIFRDIKVLLKNNLRFFRIYKELKRVRPDFIFERSEYLSLVGVTCARLLRIPHFYEANWVHYQGVQQFYRSYFNKFAKKIEEMMYASSSHVFFVGNQNLLLSLKKDNWTIIQNGVKKEVVDRFSEHRNEIDGVVKICVLASLMKHHRLDILIKALAELKGNVRFKLYFVGVNFESELLNIPERIEYEYLGPLPKEGLYDVLSKMNIAVISGGPFYSSFMKLYDYAAVKLAVICPNLSNLTNVFSDGEILFFEDQDYKDLRKKIEDLLANPDKINQYGDSLYMKVKEVFTWEQIFQRIFEQIELKINSMNHEAEKSTNLIA